MKLVCFLGGALLGVILMLLASYGAEQKKLQDSQSTVSKVYTEAEVGETYKIKDNRKE